MSEPAGGPPLPIELFEYDLPAERVAQAPARPRDASRLMLLPRVSGPPSHRRFLDLPDLLDPGDLLVVNRTQVIPARLALRKTSGGRVELLLYRPVGGDVRHALEWRALGRPGRALVPGRVLEAEDGTRLEVVGREADTVRVRGDEPIWETMQRLGQTPLPPYVERPEGPLATDSEDYQTLFAAAPGAVAAPTAALHFTDRVLSALETRGVERAELVLHVGPGTFLPVRSDHATDVRQHEMHAEWYDIPAATAGAVQRAHRAGRRVVAVGTTSFRALETWAASGETAGESTLFVYPGVEIRIVDGLLTNFHLPGSTLIMLVAAFAGRERVLRAYAAAVGERYRFFSYGDAMLII